jgi:hypothetical protein
MRQIRINIKNKPAVYLIYNQIKTDEPDLNDYHQNLLFRLIQKAADICQMELIAYTIFQRGYYILVKSQPKPIASLESMIAKLAAFNQEINSKSYHHMLTMVHTQPALIKNFFKSKIADLEAFVRLFSMSYCRLHNKINNHRGAVWRHRFQSNIIEETPTMISNIMAYIFTRPVFFGCCTDPAACPLSSWTQALQKADPIRKTWLSLTGQSDWKALKKLLSDQFMVFSQKKYNFFLDYTKSEQFDKIRQKRKKTSAVLQKKEAEWHQKYEQFKTFLAKNPFQLWPRKSEDPELYHWRKIQHELLRYNRIGKNRKEKLMQLNYPGFTHISIRIGWLEKYYKLKEFYVTHPDQNAIPEKSLTHFIYYNRIFYKKGKLRPIQIDLLNQIHFKWDKSVTA